jgi:hypothetical protein
MRGDVDAQAQTGWRSNRAPCASPARRLSPTKRKREQSLSRKLARELLAAFYLMAAREGQDWPTLASRA